MVGWHHRLNGHEFEQALGDGEGQGSLACCSSWGRKDSDLTAATEHLPVLAFVSASFLSYGQIRFHCINMPHVSYPLIS